MLTLEQLDANDPKLRKLIAFAQVIPAEMMTAIKDAALAKGISIDTEIYTRLLATFIKPSAFGTDSTLNHILNQKTQAHQAKVESELRRKGWLYVYEIDKLRILLNLKDKLPKHFKENFSIIDVEKESVRLLAELAEQENDCDGTKSK